MEVYHNRPNFADADAQEDARQRLTHVRRGCLVYPVYRHVYYVLFVYLSPCFHGSLASPRDNVHKERLSLVQSNIYFRNIKYL